MKMKKGCDGKGKAKHENASTCLLDLYDRHRGGRSPLTTWDIKWCMLGMCRRRALQRGTLDHDNEVHGGPPTTDHECSRSRSGNQQTAWTIVGAHR